MDYQQRMELVRLYGPRRPLLRHVLLMLCLYDTPEGGLVFGGRLEQETGYSDRAIREALHDLVVMGWLRPEKDAHATDPRHVSRNQYVGGMCQGPARDRVHGHLGGRRPGGDGCKTRYWITYRTSAAAERPRGRKVKKGERGAGDKGERGAAPPPPSSPVSDPARGNGAPGRGNGAPKKGEPRSPDSISEREKNRDAGGYPPVPPGDVAAADTPGGTTLAGDGPLPLAAADAADCPPGSSHGAVAPDCHDPTDPARQARQLRAIWPAICDQVLSVSDHDPGVRLWILSPKVEPMSITGAILHVACPSLIYAQRIDRYAPLICAAVTTLCRPVSTIVCHPQDVAA